MEPNIIPLCLYTNFESNSSYISLPVKIRENNKIKLICEPKQNTDFISVFYVINPDFRPIPPGTVLFCAKNTEQNSSTLSVEQVYDPFNIDDNCIRFIAWLNPVPYTTPLYLMKYQDSLYISFDNNLPNKNYSKVYFSPIHVLIDPRQKVSRAKGHSKTKKVFTITDNIPNFLFSNYQGRCIPDPDGVEFSTCLVDSILKSKKQPGMLEYINDNYSKVKPNYIILGLFIIITVSIILVIKKS